MPTTLEEQLQAIINFTPLEIGNPSIPPGDDFAALKAVLDTVINKLKDLEAQCSFKPTVTVIYDLDQSHSLQQPVHILLQESEEAVLVSWPELHLYAEGETANDAIAALKAEIVRLYDDLTSTPEPQLGVLPKRWLRTLAIVVRRNA